MALGSFVRRRSVPAEPPEDIDGAGPKDLELEERWLGAAVLSGDVPPVWYRQRMAALAAAGQVTGTEGRHAPSA
jgi:hypothetical protein